MCVITEPAKSLIPVLLSLGSAPLRLQCPFRSPGNLVRPNADSDSTGLGGGQDSPALTSSQQLPPAAGPLPHRAGLEETVRSLFRFPVPLKIIIFLFFIFLIQKSQVKNTDVHARLLGVCIHCLRVPTSTSPVANSSG